jgi:flavin reductase (DIM6/NTAB) family NADH-FMN oxidoreductase RutF
MATDSGAVFVHGATLWLECTPFKRIEAGDHEIVVLQIVAMAMYPDVAPMVFHCSSFRELAPAG